MTLGNERKEMAREIPTLCCLENLDYCGIVVKWKRVQVCDGKITGGRRRNVKGQKLNSENIFHVFFNTQYFNTRNSPWHPYVKLLSVDSCHCVFSHFWWHFFWFLGEKWKCKFLQNRYKLVVLSLIEFFFILKWTQICGIKQRLKWQLL